MEHFYDGQVKRYLTQFMRLMSNFAYKDSSGKIIQVPVRYGDMTRQVGTILNKNTENILQSAPFIACYIKDIKFDRPRMQNPTYVNKMHIRERAFDDANQQYLNTQGANYTIERLMPTPYVITFNADIWTTNTDQKFQLWEQITVLFNPSMEIQTTDNYVDWTSLSYLEITEGSVFESKTVPQGLNNDLSIATLQFTAPIWITPPAKVKKLGIITKIIANIFEEPVGTGKAGGYEDALHGGNIFGGLEPTARVTLTPQDYKLLILDNVAVLVPVGEDNVSTGWVTVDNVPNRPSWLNILDLYPGKFTSGLSQLRLGKPDGHEIVAYMSLNPFNACLMNLSVDVDTVPANTILTDHTDTYSRGTIDAIVNPQTFNPHSVSGQNIDRRYLILDDVVLNDTVEGPDAWSSIAPVTGQPHGIKANANDIIQWDGTQWWVLFDSTVTTSTTYITNAYTNIQYKWNGEQWSKSYDGVYENTDWRMIL
jgi:hypothetical protein